MGLTVSITALAALLFIPLFIYRGIAGFDFWWWMAANLLVLTGIIAPLDEKWRSDLAADFKEKLPLKLVLGVLSAVFLYIVFYIGNIISRRIFIFAGTGIDQVYAFKADASSLRIALLMLCIIGPGEELFWRGFVQRRLQNTCGAWRGFLAASMCYMLIHLGSGNLMLIFAAGICGLFWGFLYLRFHSMLLNSISHTAWDVTIFLLLPMV